MRYHNITKDDMLNGSGLRVVLWVSGCNHGCKGCQNPVTWNVNDGLIFDEAAKEELFAELNKDYIEGITLSGGDPLHPANRADIGVLIEEIHTAFPSKNIWLYTGYSWADINDLPFIPYVDVLVDGRFRIELLDNQLHWKGSSNQNVIHVKKSLSENNLVLFQY
ncbi:anaerobic ribonucleoside-triphosphate reductase activating protein [Anaerocolumna sp. AGMB13025]|uniref:anaerobic ribonucleoside-triphosphate reductase activating protein n=1 Tax=Anaerocolumna sp. AGMB13025 TaxID=3039116 RepID=UPI00241D2B28|nr:anaerobic ribonucleoside-triphosphate reductase activating protein [Anaerocolumna sp. AGMB13025]WFR57422.1 anaerobic ribonucleoside-triphosphate reductase activating protein [Anaerocolumna sp. AGMB13025]